MKAKKIEILVKVLLIVTDKNKDTSTKDNEISALLQEDLELLNTGDFNFLMYDFLSDGLEEASKILLANLIEKNTLAPHYLEFVHQDIVTSVTQFLVDKGKDNLVSAVVVGKLSTDYIYRYIQALFREELLMLAETDEMQKYLDFYELPKQEKCFIDNLNPCTSPTMLRGLEFTEKFLKFLSKCSPSFKDRNYIDCVVNAGTPEALEFLLRNQNVEVNQENMMDQTPLESIITLTQNSIKDGTKEEQEIYFKKIQILIRFEKTKITYEQLLDICQLIEIDNGFYEDLLKRIEDNKSYIKASKSAYKRSTNNSPETEIFTKLAQKYESFLQDGRDTKRAEELIKTRLSKAEPAKVADLLNGALKYLVNPTKTQSIKFILELKEICERIFGQESHEFQNAAKTVITILESSQENQLKEAFKEFYPKEERKNFTKDPSFSLKTALDKLPEEIYIAGDESFVKSTRESISLKIQEFYQDPFLKPIIDIAGLAAAGYYDNNSGIPPHKHFKAFISSIDKSELKSLMKDYIFGGIFFGRYTTYIQCSDDQITTTFFHELMHFVMQLVYKNKTLPYSKEEERVYTKITTTSIEQIKTLEQKLENIDKKEDSATVLNPISLLSKGCNSLAYDSSQHSAELIARFIEIYASLGVKEADQWFAENLPDFRKDYIERILPDLQNYIKTCHLNNNLDIQTFDAIYEDYTVGITGDSPTA